MSKIEPSVEIKVDDNKIYKVTLTVDEKGLQDLFIDERRGLMRGYDFYYEREVTQLFAQEYVRRNFDKIAGLIDLETVKLLATRKLAGIVAQGEIK